MTTMTSTQFSWKQFSIKHIQRESGADEHLDAEKNDDYDIPITSKASRNSRTPSPKIKKRVHNNNNNNNNKVTAATADSSPAAPVAVFEQVKKAKTRSERRAEEPEEPEQVQKKPVRRKERRSEYWVYRHDQMRGNAMKIRFQECEE